MPEANRIAPIDKAEAEGRTSSRVFVRIGGKPVVWNDPTDMSTTSPSSANRVIEMDKPQASPSWDIPYISFPRDRWVSSPRKDSEASSWKRWKDAFRSGLIAGALLGCLCTVLFHQVGDTSASNEAVSSNPTNSNEASVSGKALAALAPVSTSESYVSLMVPAITLHVLEQGPYKSKNEAAKAAETIDNQVPGVVIGLGPYSVWRAATLTAQGLLASEKGIKQDIFAKTVSFPATRVEVPSLPDKADQEALVHYFSSLISALRTLTGATEGAMTTSDALQSLKNADNARPKQLSTGSNNGNDVSSALGHQVDLAGAALQSGNKSGAEAALLKAWAELLALESQGQISK